jgi:hypothetical protein
MQRAARRNSAAVRKKGREPGTGLPLFRVVVKLSTRAVSSSVTYEIRACDGSEAISKARDRAKLELPTWEHAVNSCLMLSKEDRE